MMYEVLSGDRPFGSGLAAVPKILEAAPPPKPKILDSNPQYRPLANQLFEIILKCLQKDPNARPSADDLVKTCGDLCYPLTEREFGEVTSIHYGAWGFILAEKGSEVFFHLSSVYGKPPTLGDKVCYCSYPGGGKDRAHPVVKLRADPDST